MRITVVLTLMMLLTSVYGIPLQSAHNRIRIVATIEPLALIAKDIGGDRVDVYTIVPAYIDPHIYAPKPEDRVLAENADIFLCVGKEEFLGFFEDIPAIKLGWDYWSRNMYIPDGNPHYVWLYPPNAITIAEAIYTTLKSIDPDGGSYYAYRFGSFKQSILDIARWVEACRRIYRLSEVKVALAGSHMKPLLEYIGVEVTGVLIKGEKTATSKDIAEFRSLAKSADVILVHLLEYDLDEGRIANEISREVEVPILIFNPLPVGYENSYIEYIKVVSYGLLVSLANMKLGYISQTTSSTPCIVAVASLTVTSILLLFLLFRRYRR